MEFIVQAANSGQVVRRSRSMATSIAATISDCEGEIFAVESLSLPAQWFRPLRDGLVTIVGVIGEPFGQYLLNEGRE